MDNYELLKQYIMNKSNDAKRSFAYPSEPINTSVHESIYNDILTFCKDIESGFVIDRYNDETLFSCKVYRKNQNKENDLHICYISKLKAVPEVHIVFHDAIFFHELTAIYDLADEMRRSEFI